MAHIYSEWQEYDESHIPFQIYMKWFGGNWENSKLRVQFEFHRVLLRKWTFSDLWQFWRKTRLFMIMFIKVTLWLKIYSEKNMKEYTTQVKNSGHVTNTKHSALLSVLLPRCQNQLRQKTKLCSSASGSVGTIVFWLFGNLQSYQ